MVVHLLFDVELVIISRRNSYIRHPMVIPSLSRDLRALKDDKTTTVTLSGVKLIRTRRAVCDSTSGYNKQPDKSQFIGLHEKLIFVMKFFAFVMKLFTFVLKSPLICAKINIR